MNLPRNRQDDGQMLLRDEGRQVLLPVHLKNLRQVLLRFEVIGKPRAAFFKASLARSCSRAMRLYSYMMQRSE